MRELTTTTQVYKLDELTPSARDKALGNLRQWCNGDGHDIECELDSIIEAGENLGITFANRGNKQRSINYSFGGAMEWFTFDGSWEYRKGSIAWVVDNYPMDTDLHTIARTLYDVARRRFFDLYAMVYLSGYHGSNIRVDVENEYGHEPPTPIVDDVTEALRSFCQWAESTIRAAIEWQESEEYLSDMAQANELEFVADGSIYQ